MLLTKHVPDLELSIRDVSVGCVWEQQRARELLLALGFSQTTTLVSFRWTPTNRSVLLKWTTKIGQKNLKVDTHKWVRIF